MENVSLCAPKVPLCCGNSHKNSASCAVLSFGCRSLGWGTKSNSWWLLYISTRWDFSGEKKLAYSKATPGKMVMFTCQHPNTGHFTRRCYPYICPFILDLQFQEGSEIGAQTEAGCRRLLSPYCPCSSFADYLQGRWVSGSQCWPVQPKREGLQTKEWNTSPLCRIIPRDNVFIHHQSQHSEGLWATHHNTDCN